MKRKILALLLACMMVISMAPSTAFAYDVGEDTEDYEGDMAEFPCTCGKSEYVDGSGDTWLYTRPRTCVSWQYDAYHCFACEGVYIVIDLENDAHAPHGIHTYENGCDVDCSVCDYERQPNPHVYDGDCDTVCNECGATREPGDHLYDNDCDADCNVCGVTRTPADHVYDNNCDADCNECGEARTPADHVYDNNCDADCNECGATRTPADHVYDDNCDADCNECGATRTPADHVYDNNCDADCNECGEARTPADHVYTNDCDADCNECGATRTPSEHEYDNACDADCNECGEVRVPADHVYDNDCDADCNVCGATRVPADHVYDNDCDADCNECFATRTPADHVYDNNCDADCNVCGETRTPSEHEYDNACDADCNECGATRTPADHVYDNLCDVDCNVCGATRTVEPHTYNSQITTAPTCEGTGVETFTCTKCQHSYTAVVPAIGHNPVMGPGVLPTCSSEGYTYKIICGNEGCDMVFSTSASIAKDYNRHGNFVDTGFTTGATCYSNDRKVLMCEDCNGVDDEGNSIDSAIQLVEIPGSMLPHDYDNACDTTCNVAMCGHVRVVEPHVYDNNCDADCNVCGATRTPADHVYDNACDADCNECGATRTPADHVYDNACDADCNVCGATRTPADHDYDHDCDKDCNECGAVRVTMHIYDHACDSICNVEGCGFARFVRPHTYGVESVTPPTYTAQGYTTYVCTKCGDSYDADYNTLVDSIEFSYTVAGWNDITVVAVGSKVFVTVKMDVDADGARLETLQWAMNFDSSRLNYVGGTFGTELGDYLASSISNDQNANANGRVIVAANAKGTAGYVDVPAVDGGYEFVTLEFEVKENANIGDYLGFDMDTYFVEFTEADYLYDLAISYAGDIAQSIQVVNVLGNAVVGGGYDSYVVDVNDLAALLRAMKPNASLYAGYWMCDVDQDGDVDADDLVALRELVVSQPAWQ